MVFEATFEWNDLGDWYAVWENWNDLSKKNNLVQNGLVVTEKTKNSLIYSHDKNQVVACIGLENMLVISMRDAVLITNKNESQNVKKLLDS